MTALRSATQLSRTCANLSFAPRHAQSLLALRSIPALGSGLDSARWIYQSHVRRAETDEQKRSQEKNQDPQPEVLKAAPANLMGRDRMKSALTALLLLGAAITAWGIYDIYGVMTMWPKEIRKDLRNGLRAKYRGDFLLSAHFLTEAWEKAKKMPPSELGHEPLLKLSGVAITLATVLEADHKKEKAYEVMQDVLNHMRSSHVGILPAEQRDLEVSNLKDLNTPEKMRAVALAYRLGEMAADLKRPLEEEEKWLTFSVQAILSTMMEPWTAANESAVAATESAMIMTKDLNLPMWVNTQDLAAPFEALATFYAKQNKNDYALPLYLQAISILIPPAPTRTSIEDRCRGAQLMGNVADVILSRGASEETIAQAESWARKGLEVTTAARSMTKAKHQSCEVAYAVLLYNVALTRELSGDAVNARDMFKQSLGQSKSIGFEEGTQYAEDALRKLDTGSGNVKPFFLAIPDTV